MLRKGKDCGRRQAKELVLEEKVIKGTWRMPRHSEAMKDVVSCEKSWVGANSLRSMNLRMGQPINSFGRANAGN